MESLFAIQEPEDYPREVIIVDNNSTPPLRIPEGFTDRGLAIRLATCTTPGPAAARNVGAALAKGDWLLFLDSDCLMTTSTLSGFQQAPPGAVAYAGFIDAVGRDLLSRYYVSQHIHWPPAAREGEGPAYLVTANALVLRRAFEQVGGFDEGFPLAGGEDIDLAYRLRRIGALAFARTSVVQHDFNDGLRGFVSRFVRYGRGLRMVKRRHPGYRFPPPFTANQKAVLVNNLLVVVQWLAMYWGYQTERRR